MCDFRTITLGSGVGGEYCPSGTCGCANSKTAENQCGIVLRPLPPQNEVSAAYYSCLCGNESPCAAQCVTGKCCRKPEHRCPPPPKPIRITFKCPTYCSQQPVLMDPCCPPPIIPPTCPTPPAPASCCGSQKCGCRGR